MAIPGLPTSSGGLFSRVAGGVAGTAGNVIAGAVQSRTGIDVRQIGGAARNIESAARKVISGAIGGNPALGPLASITESNPSWGNLSPHLLANIFPMQFDDRLVAVPVPGGAIVTCPATELQFEATLNWSSPFENSGLESKAPNLMALIQSGQIGAVTNALQATGWAERLGIQETLQGATLDANKIRDAAVGRTGITRINSRQVFSGMPPIRITGSLHFRAVQDAKQEVLAPYEQILKWALPKRLADDGYFAELVKGASSNDSTVVKTLFPSEAPTMIGFRYGINSYSPMVIESIGNPIDEGIDSNGYPIRRTVQITMATLTALDQNDVQTLFLR